MAEESSPAAPQQGLSRQEIVAKLSQVPVFSIVNENMSMVMGTDKTTGKPNAVWYTDPGDARSVLMSAQAQMPDMKLHLGVTPLGTAFAIAAGAVPFGFVI